MTKMHCKIFIFCRFKVTLVRVIITSFTTDLNRKLDGFVFGRSPSDANGCLVVVCGFPRPAFVLFATCHGRSHPTLQNGKIWEWNDGNKLTKTIVIRRTQKSRETPTMRLDNSLRVFSSLIESIALVGRFAHQLISIPYISDSHCS